MSKPTVVFIHGNSLSAKTFENQLSLSSDINSLAIDLPGHGTRAFSSYDEKEFCVESYVDFVFDSIKNIETSGIVLVGHSLGGHIAIELVPKINNLKGILIFGTPPVGKPPAMDKAFLPNPSMSLLFQENWTQEELEQLLTALTANSDVASKLKAELVISNGKARTGLANCIGEGRHANELQIIADLKVPIAILHGEKDALINPEYFSEINMPTLWKGKIHVLPNAGHCPQMEASEEFNELLLQFSKEVLF